MAMGPSPQKPRAGIPSFEEKLENEEEVLDAIITAHAKNQLDPAVWQELHDAAARDDRVSELAFAYESAAQGRKLKTLLPAVQAEVFFRAATFFGDILGDEFGATTYLEKALAAQPGHPGAFDRIDAQLTRVDDNKKLAELCVQTAPHRPRADQLVLLKRGAVLYERAGLEDKAIETHQALIRLDPADESVRTALEQRYIRANRFRDAARMLEQALAIDPPLEAEESQRVRGRLIEIFANQLKEPERAMPHVEVLLEAEPTHPEARRVATRLLESKGLAARAAAALAAGAETVEDRTRYLSIELEHTRGPKRRDVLRRIGIMKQDDLGDLQGAFEAFEQALGIDPADDELRRRYIELGIQLKGPLDVARTFSRVSTVAKDTPTRSRITAEMGELLLRGGDTKRAKTTLAGILTAQNADPHATLTAARALTSVYESEQDVKNLVDVLTRVGELSSSEEERHTANLRIAEIATSDLGDVDRAIAAWRRLVDSPARERALTALEPLYEERGEWIDLSFVVEQRARDNAHDPRLARSLYFRSAEVLTTKARDIGTALEAWRQLVTTFGPARDVYEFLIPILETQKLWTELAQALTNDAELATGEEKAPVLARLGQVCLQRTRDADAAIDAFRRALEIDPQEKTSRATLEKLLVGGDQRFVAAAVLENIYRAEGNAQSLLRVLDIKAQLSPIVHERLAALEEAADVAANVSQDKAVELIARGLGEAVESGEPLASWLDRFDRIGGLDGKRRAALLAKALGDREIDSHELLALAKRVGEESAAAGDVASALVAYRRALAFEPSSTELVTRVDELLKEQGNPEERVALYRAALERGPEPARRRQLLHSIGSIERYELANADAAIFAYRRALKDDPSDREAHGALVELYAETESWDELCDVLEDRLPHASSPEEARSVRAHLADIAAGHGQKERAALHAGALLAGAQLDAAELDLVERVSILLGDNVLLRGALERRVRESGDPRQQIQCLERLASLSENGGDADSAIGHLRHAADIAEGASDDASAVGLLRRVRQIDDRDENATSRLVDLYERTEAYAAIPDLLGVLLELAKDDAARIALLRRIARLRGERLGDLRGAFDAAREAFTLAPEDRESLAELSEIATRSGATRAFAEAINEALAKTSNAPPAVWTELTLARARVLASSEQTWSDAAATYRQVLEKSEDDAHTTAASHGLEELLRSMPPSGARSREVRWLHAWRVDRAPAETRARTLFGWAEAEENELGDATQALVLYKRVLEIEDGDLDALSAVSRLSLAQGDVEGALAALVARRSASEGDAKNTLDVQIATILASRPGRASEALDRVAAVLENAPHEQAALELAAKLLSHPDVGGSAAAVLERSLDAVEDVELKATIYERLVERSEPRRDLFERYLDLLKEQSKGAQAYSVALRAVRALPSEASLWERAENFAREEASAEPLADAYEHVLAQEMANADAMELGQRAVAFFEEWYEDGTRVVRVLERLLEIEPEDTWAFDRLKLIFDAQERWDELFALYDRAAKGADKERRIELLEEAAQIAKDFANHSTRAIGYLEQLLELRPGNARLSSALERLYERHGCHRELIGLLGNRLPQLSPEDAQKERGRIASFWLNELGDASSALIVIEDIVANQLEGDAGIDVTELLERVLAVAPKTQEVRESLPPPPEGRRDSYLPVPPKRGLVRQRTAALLKERYAGPGREPDLARVLEVELEAVKSVKERIRRHQQIAAIYMQLGNDEAALEHFVHLVLLEPEVAAHRQELTQLASRIGMWSRLAEVLVTAADDSNDDALKVDLLMQAGDVTAQKIDDAARAITLFFRILTISPIADSALLEACRHLEPLLANAGRSSERLDVLERLAILEGDDDVRMHVLGEAARLATELGEDDRAIWAWEGRLETVPQDPESLDGLVSLFEKVERWRPLIDALGKRAQLDRPDEERRADRIRIAQIQSQRIDAVEEAIETWRGIEEAFGESDDGTRALGALFRSTRRYAELAALLARAAERALTPGDKAETLRDLGDVQREQLDDVEAAIASYEASLREDPRREGSRSGLRALLKRPEHRRDVVRVLLDAYNAADDWRLVLDLTEHRLGAAKETSEQIAVLAEAARISETRAEDLEAAFALQRRALLWDPSREATIEEIFRLADLTRSFRALAEALRECVDRPESPEPSWARTLRFRMGGVLETRLDEPRAALDAYVHVATQDTSNLEVARAVIRVAGRTMRWDAAARAVVETTRARGVLEADLCAAIEETASAAGGWDAVTFAVASLVHDGGGLPPNLARDLEAQIAIWHRDRRGDPDAAESAFGRALGHDPSSAQLLAELARLQRRAKGRPLVDSLLRLSQTTGGDLDLLTEAADVALTSVGDRALAKSIFDRLLKLAAERWLGATEPNLSSGTPSGPDAYVDRAARELVRIHTDDGDHDKVVQLLVETAQLPWKTEKARALRHEAAVVAETKLGAADRAIGIYLALIEEDPRDAEAVTHIVALYENGNRSFELLELKRRLVTTAASTEERLGLRLEVAKLEDGLGDTSRAISVLEENLSESPRHEATVHELSTLLAREQKSGPLEALYASQAKLAEGAQESALAADLFAKAAEVAERSMNDLPRAIRHLERVVNLEPTRGPALDALARLSTSTKNHEAASGYLDRLRDISEGSTRADVTLRLADALSFAGRKADARQRLESEIGLDPEADRVRVRLAEVCRAAQDWKALAELLTEGAHHAPDKATRLSRLREAAELHRVRTGEPDRAIPLLEQASDLAPDENPVKLALADALGTAGRFEEARALLGRLVEAFGGRRPKERAPVHYHLARLDLALGDRARALVELDAATKIDPANPEILRALAELARDDGQLERAERSYRALLTVLRRQEEANDETPITRSEVLFELSQIADRQGENDRAKEILESAFELSAENVVEARRLEAALRKSNDNAGLARALEARLARGSDDPGLFTELGRVYEEYLGRKEDAFEMRLRALDLDPISDEIHDAASRLATELGKVLAYEARVRNLADARGGSDGELAGALYLRLGNIAETQRKDDKEAAAFYEKALAVRSDGASDRGVLEALSRVYERLDDDAGQARVLALRVSLDADEGGASADTLYRLAQLRFRADDLDAGCDALEQALELEPNVERGQELLRAALDGTPEHERAIGIYERLAREPGHERSLVDALVRRWALPGAASEPMREAVELAEQLQDRELAESLLRRFLENANEDPASRVWALSLLATHCEAAGRVREAVLFKREAAELAEPDSARKLLFEVAVLAAGPLGDMGLAASIYEELHEREPQDREAWELLLEHYRRTKENEKLVALIAEIVGYVDDIPERSKLRFERVKVGMDRLGLSDDEAARELRDIVDEDPAQVEAAILFGSILERSGREEDLADLLARQLDAAKDRQEAEAVSSLSQRLGELVEKRDKAQARDIYYTALDWDPKAKAILQALERLHEEEGEVDSRADIIEKRLALETGDTAEELALSLAEIRRSRDDASGAVRALEVGFKAAPSSTRLRDQLESLYREQVELKKLAELYEVDAGGRSDPKERSTRLRDAARIWREELATPAEAARVLRDARAADPTDPLLLAELVDTLTAAGEHDVAAEELTSAIEALAEDDPLRADLVGRRAIVRSRLNDGEGALADFEEAIAKGQVDLRAYLCEHLAKLAVGSAGRNDLQEWRGYRLRIAQLRVEMGDITEARNVLTELLKADSKDKATLRAVAYVDELEGDWAAASATYRRLVGLEDETGIVSAAMKLAETCEKAGRLADARGGLERARLAAPNDVELRQRLAWLYEQLGAVKELAELVLEDARAAGDVGPRFDGLVHAGQLYLAAASDPNAAAQIGVGAAIVPLEEAHALRPADLDCAALLSDAYVLGGRVEEGNELIQRMIASFKGRRARELSALYHRLARIAEIGGDQAGEINHLTTALDMDSQNGAVASELAFLAMEAGLLDLAQRALRQITMLKTPAPLAKALAYQYLGEIARQQGDPRRAMMMFKRALDDDPNLESARTLLDALQAEM